MSTAPQTQQTQAPAKREERETLEALIKRPGVAGRFDQVLKDKAPQYLASVLSIGRTMPDVEPRSILASAMIAATLDLPIEKNLGFAWIIPYRDQGKQYAQFQMGYKGYIQLALRTGRYTRMNAVPINTEALGGFDAVGEPVINWDKLDPTKEAVGYVFAFQLTGGFTKVAYWSKKKVENHAQKYSQSYRGGFKSPWKTHFDQMALKTVIANELSDWGILSVQWQQARTLDQGVVTDIDAEVRYVDNVPELDDRKPEATGLQQATQTATTGPAPEELAKMKQAKKEPEPPKTPQDEKQGVTTPPAGQTPAQTGTAAQETTQKPTTTRRRSTQSFANEDPEQQAKAAETAKTAPQTQEQAENEAAEAAAGLAPVTQTPATTPAAEPNIPQVPSSNRPPFKPNASESDALQSVRLLLYKVDRPEEELMTVLRANKVAKDGQKIADLAEFKLMKISSLFPALLQQMDKAKQAGDQGNVP